MDEKLLPIIAVERLRMATDGPGVRTLVCTCGCPMRCRYCLNPQSWDGRISPKLFSARQLYERVRIDSLYFQATGGGVTFGGGEPLLHMAGIRAFADLCPEDRSLWAETSLNVSRAAAMAAARVFDHLIVDLKTTDEGIYKAYTGCDMEPAVNNLLYLRDILGPERITVRLPLIPGYADAAEQARSAALVAGWGFIDIDTFHYRLPGEKRGRS